MGGNFKYELFSDYIVASKTCNVETCDNDAKSKPCNNCKGFFCDDHHKPILHDCDFELNVDFKDHTTCSFENCDELTKGKFCSNCGVAYCDKHINPKIHLCKKKFDVFRLLFFLLLLITVCYAFVSFSDLEFESSFETNVFAEIKSWFAKEVVETPIKEEIFVEYIPETVIVETADWILVDDLLTTTQECKFLVLGKAASELSKKSLYITFCRNYCAEAGLNFSGNHGCNVKDQLECVC
jgi:hypothetical protein